jgi:hypothetical protein
MKVSSSVQSTASNAGDKESISYVSQRMETGWVLLISGPVVSA